MTLAGWLQLAALLVALAISTPLLGTYMAKVFGDERRAPGDRFFLPVERAIYRLCRIDPDREQRWTVYAYSLLAFSAVSGVVLYAQLRLQGHLPLNPDGMKAVSPGLSFNTAVSFLTNTNWQNYSGESTMSHLTQMAGLALHNFVSAAAGAAVAVALIRGLVRRRSATIGNFWVDLTRTTTRLLLPLSFAFALVLASQGVVQNFHAARTVQTMEGATQSLPGGPIASQEAIKNLGENGGGPYNANASHPFENPNPITNILIIWGLLAIPFAFPFTFGKMARDRKQGWVVFAAMFALWLGGALIAMPLEARGNPKLTALGANQRVVATQSGGNMEGKEVRFGPAACGLFADSTTGTSTGSVNCAHDSLTPLGGAVPLVNMMLGEVSPGGTGSGLYGMLVFALTSVFIAGLMVGRTPEYLGKKIQAVEMKLVVLYLLAVPIAILSFAGASVLLKGALSSLANDGPHGLSEMTYAFTSASNNNGSAFGGLTGNTQWFNTTLGLCMLVGRFLLMVPVLAIAGSLGRKQPVPVSAGTFPTGTPLFAALLTAVVVIVVGLTYFPVVALGPVVEHLAGKF
jgi:potassium-transporting ATPase potassium-binding subunit